MQKERKHGGKEKKKFIWAQLLLCHEHMFGHRKGNGETLSMPSWKGNILSSGDVA